MTQREVTASGKHGSHVVLQDKVNQPQIYGLKRLYTGRGRNEISYAGLKLPNYDKYTESLRNNVAIQVYSCIECDKIELQYRSA